MFQRPSLLLTLPKSQKWILLLWYNCYLKHHKGEENRTYRCSLHLSHPCFIYKIIKEVIRSKLEKNGQKVEFQGDCAYHFSLWPLIFYSRVVAVSFLESLLLSPLPFSLHSFDRSLRSHRPRIRHRHPLGEKCGTTFLPLWLKPADRR